LQQRVFTQPGSSAPFPRCPRNVGLSSDSGRIAALPRTVETGQKLPSGYGAALRLATVTPVPEGE